MSNLLIVAGYGDRTGYIHRLTRHWHRRGLDVTIHPFGTLDSADTYDQHWGEFARLLQQTGKTAVLGISFGGSVTLRALQEFPDIISNVVCISAPHSMRHMDPQKVDSQYPMLRVSLAHIEGNSIDSGRVMTVSPLHDSIVPPVAVPIEGADNRRVPVIGHGFGIAAALVLQANAIADFVNSAEN